MLRLLIAFTLFLTLSAACGGNDSDDSGGVSGYPDSGEDRFERTVATVQIEVTQPQASLSAMARTELETVELAGPALVMRSDPVLEGDVFVVKTEIREMELRGTSSLGPVIVRESADRASKGEVRQQEAGQNFPAASYFDVFVEVELPDLDLTLHNEDPMHMTSTLESLPPEKGERYRGEDDRPLYTPAGIAVGRIVDALHIPQPEGEDGEEEPDATATTGATPTQPKAAATAAPTSAAPATKGGCVHGAGQSVLHIVFRGLTAGQTVTGSVGRAPDGGLISEPVFTATADAAGVARVQKDIRRFGAYGWTTDGGISGEFTIEQECPGVP